MQAMNHMIELGNEVTEVSLLGAAKKRSKRFVHSLEYELIASLAIQQYTKKDTPDFVALLSIPIKDRIPGLVKEYGLKRMHHLVKTILKEFCFSIALPKSRKLTETKMSVLSCDLILVAEEDGFSLEDLIIFFELAKKGKWGLFKSLLTHFSLMEKLECYRQERYDHYIRIKSEMEKELKMLGPQERISPEPTPIKNLFDGKGGKIVPFRKTV